MDRRNDFEGNFQGDFEGHCGPGESSGEGDHKRVHGRQVWELSVQRGEIQTDRRTPTHTELCIFRHSSYSVKGVARKAIIKGTFGYPWHQTVARIVKLESWLTCTYVQFKGTNVQRITQMWQLSSSCFLSSDQNAWAQSCWSTDACKYIVVSKWIDPPHGHCSHWG